jgi:hypothetical protein
VSLWLIVATIVPIKTMAYPMQILKLKIKGYIMNNVVPTKLSKNELYLMLMKHGYKIVTDRTREDDVTVTFTSTIAFPYKLKHSYSKNWTDDDIIRDMVYNLLHWAELKVKYTLE